MCNADEHAEMVRNEFGGWAVRPCTQIALIGNGCGKQQELHMREETDVGTEWR